MNEFDVKVVGARRNRQSSKARARLLSGVGRRLRALLMRPRLLGFLGVCGFVLLVGTPHSGWEYQCNHPMHGPGTCRSVSWCAYYGIQGRRVEFPEPGESCKLVTLLPIDWQRASASAGKALQNLRQFRQT